jgi:hypothetical protein
LSMKRKVRKIAKCVLKNCKLPCWMTIRSKWSFTAALSTTFSSTVPAVTKRKTRTCFFCPIRWDRSFINTYIELLKNRRGITWKITRCWNNYIPLPASPPEGSNLNHR